MRLRRREPRLTRDGEDGPARSEHIDRPGCDEGEAAGEYADVREAATTSAEYTTVERSAWYHAHRWSQPTDI